MIANKVKGYDDSEAVWFEREEETREPHEREGKGMMMMRKDRREDSGNWSVKDK